MVGRRVSVVLVEKAKGKQVQPCNKAELLLYKSAAHEVGVGRGDKEGERPRRKGGPEDVTKVRDQTRKWVASCLVNSCLKKAAKQWGMRVGRGVGEDHVVCWIRIADDA